MRASFFFVNSKEFIALLQNSVFKLLNINFDIIYWTVRVSFTEGDYQKIFCFFCWSLHSLKIKDKVY